MSNKARILAALGDAKAPVCDDCLSVLAEVAPRQTVFQVCSALSRSRAILRDQKTCSRCNKLKKTSEARELDAPRATTESEVSPAPVSAAVAGTTIADHPWHWEGHVQGALARFLKTDGWAVTAVTDTESKAHGIDLIATKESRWLTVEVKGYPTDTFERGPKRGQPKPTPPASQARQWFSHALLEMMLLRSNRPDAEIALCFPEFRTYRALGARTRGSFELLGFGLYFVAENGAVRLEIPHRALPVLPAS